MKQLPNFKLVDHSKLNDYAFISAPSSSPLGIQVQQTDNPGELIASWIPPPRDSHNGALQGYHVKAVPKSGGEPGNLPLNFFEIN